MDDFITQVAREVLNELVHQGKYNTAKDMTIKHMFGDLELFKTNEEWRKRVIENLIRQVDGTQIISTVSTDITFSAPHMAWLLEIEIEVEGDEE